jgi:nitroreductase
MKTLVKEYTQEQKATSQNETLKIIYERRAVRKYKRKQVEKSLIEDVLNAGRMAPSAINKQPWKFYVLTNEETISEFSKEISKVAIKGVIKTGLKGIIKTIKEFLHFSHGADFFNAKDPIFHGAPVVIFVTSPKNDEWAALDIGMACQNMMLAAKSLGLDSCPVGLGKFVEQVKDFPKLNIPGSEMIHLAVILGYGDEKPQATERVQNNSVFL